MKRLSRNSLMLPLIFLCLTLAPTLWGGELQMAPDGSFVVGTPHLAPDGSFVGGRPILTPDGNWVGSGEDEQGGIIQPQKDYQPQTNTSNGGIGNLWNRYFEGKRQQKQAQEERQDLDYIFGRIANDDSLEEIMQGPPPKTLVGVEVMRWLILTSVNEPQPGHPFYSQYQREIIRYQEQELKGPEIIQLFKEYIRRR